jgi:transmembrane sensor
MPATESNIDRIAQLIRAFQLDELDDPSRRELENWRFENTENESLFVALNQPDQLQAKLAEMASFNAEASYAAFESKFIKEETPVALSQRSFIKWRHVVGIAAALAFIISGIWFFKTMTVTDQAKTTAYEADIAPGRVGATLTLADGKKIRLSDAKNGELAKEAGITINKSASGQLVYEITSGKSSAGHINTLSTTNGETYKVSLPDGTQIWLNAASKLMYTTNLIKNGKRVVQLEGEAYFEVSKDKKHPFVVESKGQFVEVLGTHFNINAYKDEPQIATTLLEGSVKVGVNGKMRLIRPGQQAVNYSGRLQVNEVSLDDVMDWKEGDFFLNHVDFKTVMRKIARWYDVEIVYDVAIPDDLEYGGWMSRRNNLSTVLKAIESTGLAKFRIEDKKVHVYN